jgi:site-specific DNA-methyltransferase (adenine-specific)
LAEHRILTADVLEAAKEFEDNTFDALLADPPYFLVNNSGKGFMGKSWDSINKNNMEDIVWKSQEFVQFVVEFLKLTQIDSSMAEEKHAQKSAATHSNHIKIQKLNLNVPSVEKNFGDQGAKLIQNTNSAQMIVLTKEEVLDSLKEMSINHITVKEKLKENVLFAIPFSFIQKALKSIAQENVLSSLIGKECLAKPIPLTLTEEVKINSRIEGMIGTTLERISICAMDGSVQFVEEGVGEGKSNVITSNHTDYIKIMIQIISLLSAFFVTKRSKGNPKNFLTYLYHKNWSLSIIEKIKPGGYLLAFGAPRTYHIMTKAFEDAGFEIRDCLMYVFGSGFPKSYNIGNKINGWDGYGTALKPAYEPIILARKPVEGNNVKNCLKYGCGGLNIDECRIGYSEKDDPRIGKEYSHNAKAGLENGVHKDNSSGQKQQLHKPQGRWPANLILDGSEEVEEMFPTAPGQQGDLKNHTKTRQSPNGCYGKFAPAVDHQKRNDAGSASRFFQKCLADRIVYSSKVSKKERNAGLDALEDQEFSRSVGAQNNNEYGKEHIGFNKKVITKNPHPTLKPVSLCEYLARLVLPPKRETPRKIVVPFAGTGSEMAGALRAGWDEVVGIEYEEEYCDIAEKRIPALEVQGE